MPIKPAERERKTETVVQPVVSGRKGKKKGKSNVCNNTLLYTKTCTLPHHTPSPLHAFKRETRKQVKKLEGKTTAV